MSDDMNTQTNAPWWKWAIVVVRLLSVAVICLMFAWIGVSYFDRLPEVTHDAGVPAPTAIVKHDPGNSSWPMTVHTQYGDVTIDKAPARVVALDEQSADALLAVGVTPLGMPAMTSATADGAAIMPWVANALSIQKPQLFHMGERALPFDEIASVKPDLIVAVDAPLHRDQYAALSRIAPTIAAPSRTVPGWRETTRIIGSVMGRARAAEKAITTAENAVKSARESHPEFAGQTLGVLSSTDPDNVTVYLRTDPTMDVPAALGFVPDASFDALNPAGDVKFVHVPWSQLPHPGPRVLITWFGDESIQGHAENVPEYRSLGAIAAGRVVLLKDPTVVFAFDHPSPLNIPWLVDALVPRLADATQAHGDAAPVVPAVPHDAHPTQPRIVRPSPAPVTQLEQ